jgi:DNA polymerase-1
VKRIVAVDTETTGLSPYGSFEELGHFADRPFAFSFTHYDGKEFYVRFSVDPFTRRVDYDSDRSSYSMLRAFFADESIVKVFHNAQFDLNMLEFAGLTCKGPFYDTRILAHLADSSRHSFALKPLTKAIFDFPDDDLKVLKDSVKVARRKGKKLGWKLAEDVEADYHLGDPELCKKYALGDTQRTMQLFKFYEPLLTNEYSPEDPYFSYRALAEMEHALIPIVMEMSREGATLDMAKVAELENYYLSCMEKAKQARINAGYEDLNPKSPQQVIDVMYNQLGAAKQFKSRKDKKSGKRSKTLTVDKKVLAGLSNTIPLAQHLLEYSEAEKQLTGFIRPFKENSFNEKGNRVIHPGYNTVGPVTGRMSCKDPNLQNITSPDSAGKLTNIQFRVRECFAPPKDHIWLLSDYGQIEIYCTAYLSGDRVMIDALESGKKLHDITCVDVLKGVPGAPDWEAKRKKAKITNFLLQYRGGAGQLAQTLGIPYEEALGITRRYWETYAGLDDFYKRLEKEYKKNGFVKSLFGRPFRVLFEKDSYKLGNYVSQGTAAEIIKKAMIEVAKRLPYHQGTKLILQVHDELIFKAPKRLVTEEGAFDLMQLVQDIEGAMKGNFGEMLGMPGHLPVETSIAAKNWGEKVKYSPN